MLNSSIITDAERYNPTPGDVLMEEFLEPLALSQTALAKAIRVPPRRINEIILGKRAVTPDTDLRLSRYFGLSHGFFLNLQKSHDIRAARWALGAALDTITPHPQCDGVLVPIHPQAA